MAFFFKTALIALNLIFYVSNGFCEDIPTKDFSKIENIKRDIYKNLLQFELGNENLVIGLSYYRFLDRHNALGIGFGTWLHNASGGILYKFFPLKSDWSPYTGCSLMAYSLSSHEDKIGNKSEIDIDALGLYFPLGIQYIHDKGLTVSFEISTYFSSLFKLILEKKLILEEGNKDKALSKLYLQNPSKFYLWGGIKIGFAF